MSAIDALLADALASDPTRPLLTYYDDATGERTELSATTLAGWVAKTAGLVQDELAVEPGDRVAVLLPAHWQTAAVLLAGWSVGAVLDTDPAGAAVVFCDADRLELARSAGAGEIVALSLAPLGRPFAEPPAGALDYAAVVPGQPDNFSPYAPISDDAPAALRDGMPCSAADLVAASRDAAARQGISGTSRVLSTRPWNGLVDWLAGLLAPLAAGASLVLCANADQAALPRRIDSERVTLVLTPSDSASVRPIQF